MQLRVFVLLPRHLNAILWEQSFLKGHVPDRTPYGYHFARELGATVTFSEATPTPNGVLGLLDKGLKRLLGFDIRHVWRNRQSILRADFDVIWTHTEYEHLGISALRLLFNSKGVPFIAQSIWLLDEWNGYSWVKKKIYRLLMRQAAIGTFHSEANRRTAQKLALHKSTEVIQFGISQINFPTRVPRLRFDRGLPIRILVIGNDRHRDWATLFEAIANRSDYEVRVGSQKWPASLTAENISVSALEQQSLYASYAWADCVVIPLKENLHASGITVMLEAVACGVPVIATKTGGLDDYIDNAGIHYVPPADSIALRTTIYEIALNPERAMMACSAAQLQVEVRELTTKGFAERHVHLSKRLVKPPLGQNKHI